VLYDHGEREALTRASEKAEAAIRTTSPACCDAVVVVTHRCPCLQLLNPKLLRNRHSVLYDDGEREALALAGEKLKWLLPPEVGPSEDSARRRRPRRRAVSDSSSDDVRS